MLGAVKCHDCGHVGSATSMPIETDNMVVSFGSGKDCKGRRIIKDFTVMAATHYCVECYQQYQEITKIYQNNNTLYLSAGTNKADAFINKYSDIFSITGIASGVRDLIFQQPKFFIENDSSFRKGKRKNFDTTNIYEALDLLSTQSATTTNNTESKQQPEQKTNDPNDTTNSSPPKPKRAGKWSRKEVKHLINWIQYHVPTDAKSLESHIAENGLQKYMQSQKLPPRTANAYAVLYVISYD